MLAAADQKTRTCPYCSTKIDLHKTFRLAQVEDASQASEMLRIIKEKRQANPKKPKTKPPRRFTGPA
jgi:hypothetical protein